MKGEMNERRGWGRLISRLSLPQQVGIAVLEPNLDEASSQEVGTTSRELPSVVGAQVFMKAPAVDN